MTDRQKQLMKETRYFAHAQDLSDEKLLDAMSYSIHSDSKKKVNVVELMKKAVPKMLNDAENLKSLWQPGVFEPNEETFDMERPQAGDINLNDVPSFQKDFNVADNKMQAVEKALMKLFGKKVSTNHIKEFFSSEEVSKEEMEDENSSDEIEVQVVRVKKHMKRQKIERLEKRARGEEVTEYVSHSPDGSEHRTEKSENRTDKYGSLKIDRSIRP